MAGSHRNSNKEVSRETRLNIAAFLLEHTVNLKLPRGLNKKAADLFDCSDSTASRLWKEIKQHRNNGEGMPSFQSKRRGKCGRKKVLTDIPARVKVVPLRKHRAMRSIAAAIDVSPLSVQRSLDAGEIVRHSNSIKPRLIEEDKTSRYVFRTRFFAVLRLTMLPV